MCESEVPRFDSLMDAIKTTWKVPFFLIASWYEMECLAMFLLGPRGALDSVHRIASINSMHFFAFNSLIIIHEVFPEAIE